MKYCIYCGDVDSAHRCVHQKPIDSLQPQSVSSIVELNKLIAKNKWPKGSVKLKSIEVNLRSPKQGIEEEKNQAQSKYESKIEKLPYRLNSPELEVWLQAHNTRIIAVNLAVPEIEMPESDNHHPVTLPPIGSPEFEQEWEEMYPGQEFKVMDNSAESARECKCTEPNCSKCLSTNCQDKYCKIHKREDKITWRNKWERVNNKRFPYPQNY